MWQFEHTCLYYFETTYPWSKLHLMRNSFASRICFVLPSTVWVAFVAYYTRFLSN
jgi:hypothetical protein